MSHDRLTTAYQAIFAPRCTLCHAPAPTTLDLCDACRAELPWQRRGCRHCGLTLPQSAQTDTCAHCLHAPRFDTALATFEYQTPVDWLITRLKFHRRLTHARLLGTLMAARMDAHSDTMIATSAPDYIVPVPLHPRRLRERGYNQAELLARRVARLRGLHVRTGLVRRHRYTPPQMSLPAAERRHNVHDAFAVVGDCHGHDIAIVDDVVTTGHTASALAIALRGSGAAHLRLWCAARA